MVGGADAGIGHRELAVLPQCNEVGQGLDRRVGRHDEDGRHALDMADRGEGGAPVVGRVAVDGRHRDQRVGRDQQGGAVGRGAGDDVAADHAARAGLVLDDDGGAQHLAQLVGDDARGDVDVPARRIGRHDLDRLVESLGQGRSRPESEAEKGPENRYQAHELPPVYDWEEPRRTSIAAQRADARAARVAASQSAGGRCCAHGRAASSRAPSRSTSVSAPHLPTTCTEVGRPSVPKPDG